MKHIGLTLLFLMTASYCLSQNNDAGARDEDSARIHSLGFNPLKPFIGLLNVQYEFQAGRKFGLTVFSEYLAYQVIENFNHPDMVSKVGFSYYPFMDELFVNEKWFVNVNASYVVYVRDTTQADSLANGLEIGYKALFGQQFFIQPRALVNYTYSVRKVLPGLEVVIGGIF